MNLKRMLIRKLLVVSILSFGLMPMVLDYFFSDAFVSYSTGVFLSCILFTLYGFPCSIASEWITFQFKKVMTDFHPGLVALVSSGTYVSLHVCFGLLFIVLAIILSPEMLMAFTVMYSVVIGSLLFAAVDLIIGIIQKQAYKTVGK